MTSRPIGSTEQDRERAREKDRKPSATERYAQAVGLDL